MTISKEISFILVLATCCYTKPNIGYNVIRISEMRIDEEMKISDNNYQLHLQWLQQHSSAYKNAQWQIHIIEWQSYKKDLLYSAENLRIAFLLSVDSSTFYSGGCFVSSMDDSLTVSFTPTVSSSQVTIIPKTFFIYEIYTFISSLHQKNKINCILQKNIAIIIICNTVYLIIIDLEINIQSLQLYQFS